MEPALWDTLRRVRTLRFVARGSAGTGWTGAGEGSVAVDEPAQGVLTFAEAGVWRPDTGGALGFRNVFRWTLLEPDRVRLEHLRFGADRPVFLFDLAPDAGGGWRSVEGHVCRDDLYTAVLAPRPDSLALHWSVEGPRKQERIEYAYGFG